MRILFDATPLQTGHRLRGVGTYSRELLKTLLAIDRDNQYALIVHGRQGLPDLPPNASLVRLPRPPAGRLSAFFSHQVFLPVLFRRLAADLFHSPGFVAAFSVPGVPWHCPYPLVVTLHDFIPLHMPELFNNRAINRWWYKRQMEMVRRSALLVCVSEATRQDALRFLQVPLDRCAVVPEGVDPQRFAPGGRKKPHPPFVLFVGGDFPNKNRRNALIAFGRLCQRRSLPHQLVLIGHGGLSGEALQRLHPGLDPRRVRWLPSVTQDRLVRLYQDADLLLFPSLWEGFGLPVLEAMASGTPVITSTTSSLPEVAGEAALLVDPHDPEALAQAMARVLGDRDLWQRLQRDGLARAAAFNWQATARGTLACYDRVLGATRPGGVPEDTS